MGQVNTFSGKIIAVMEIKTGTSAKGEWAMQEFVVEEDKEKYPQRAVFTLFGRDKISAINPQVGESVTVHYDLTAKEYSGRWYGTNMAYKVEKSAGAIQPTPQRELTPEEQQKVNSIQKKFEQQQNTLPF